MGATTLPLPLLLFIRGLPGSGKSFIARQLVDELHAVTGRTIVNLDPDAIDYDSEAYKAHVAEQNQAGVEPALHAYRYLRGQAYAAIAESGIAVWNQPFTNAEIFNKMIGRMREQASIHKVDVTIVVVEVHTDPAIAKQRVNERKAAGGHGPSDGTFARFVEDYKSLASEGYNTIVVDGQDDVANSVQAIMNHLHL